MSPPDRIGVFVAWRSQELNVLSTLGLINLAYFSIHSFMYELGMWTRFLGSKIFPDQKIPGLKIPEFLIWKNPGI